MGRLATRRELVAGAAAAAEVAAVADPALADAPPVSDADALSKALEVERLMVLAYQRVLASGSLAPDIERALAPYLGHEIQHASAVADALAAIGVKATTAPLDRVPPPPRCRSTTSRAASPICIRRTTACG